MMLNNVYKLTNRLKTYKILLFLSFLVFVSITAWQGYYADKVHNTYQSELMLNVANRVDSEYQSLINNQKIKINNFQLKYKKELSELISTGVETKEEDYMVLLKEFKSNFKELNLFSVINEKQEGVFKHITGDFLPDCKEEVNDVLTKNKQEHLFLHRSKKSMFSS